MTLEVDLESLAFGGDAVGHVEGKAIFVPFGAPGDRAKVTIVSETRRFSRATLEEVIEAGPGRRPPPCPHFGVCGGCQWQHISYHQQLQAKSSIFQRALARAGAEEIIPPTPASSELAYRSRARLHWEKRGEKISLGYYRWRSKVIHNIDQCPVLTPSVQSAVMGCREVLAALPPSSGSLVLVTGGAGDVHISLRVRKGAPPLSSAQARGFLNSPVVGGQLIQGREVLTFGRSTVDLHPSGGQPLLASAATFTQANVEQEQLLRQRVALWARPEGREVLELYAGIGTLSQGLSQGARALTVVESNTASIEYLRQNVAGAEHIMGEATRVASALTRQGRTFDVVVVDPPREGCKELCRRLAELQPQRIIYVSCDPMTLARDIQILGDQGYHPRRAQLLDMMPQSFHIEGLVQLDLLGGNNNPSRGPRTASPALTTG